MEKQSFEPSAGEAWEHEVYLTKVRDRLVLIKNKDEKKFISALASIDQTDEFIALGTQLESFVVSGSEPARKFVEVLGADFDLLTANEDVSPDNFR